MKNTGVIFAALFLVCLGAQAADRNTLKITMPGANGGTVTKTVTKTLLPTDGISTVCGKPLHFGGMADDGVRTLNCDGTGTYLDGKFSGTFTWYYAVSETDPTKLFIQSFADWGMGPAPTSAPAVAVYMIYKGGSLDGKTYGAVIGVVDGQIQLSPNFASKR